MSFIVPSDVEYQRAKRLRQRKSRLDPIYDDFVERFRQRYGFPPLAISLDAIDRPGQPRKTPRLGVVLERSRQYNSFLRDPYSYDSRKQHTIAGMFAEALSDHSPHRMPRRPVRVCPCGRGGRSNCSLAHPAGDPAGSGTGDLVSLPPPAMPADARGTPNTSDHDRLAARPLAP
ncbi:MULTISPECIES: hypothetical protein [Kribbella]|uniref:hypothetical protein n=1 Tax=Kribbella TaxID=182639 RepID=UPI001048F428|nr:MULTISPECIES: hypothetical protein [Kribbella]